MASKANPPHDGEQQKNAGLWLSAFLLLFVMGSAIAVIYTSHKNRQTFNLYQQQLTQRDELETEWGQLLLEQSALAAHARVERIAIDKLDMKAPNKTQVILVSQ